MANPPAHVQRGASPTDGHRRLTPLDGIRALAVATVLLFHGGVSWEDGGLLGVDVFFVLSGFLITALLCDESVRTDPIGWSLR